MVQEVVVLDMGLHAHLNLDLLVLDLPLLADLKFAGLCGPAVEEGIPANA